MVDEKLREEAMKQLCLAIEENLAAKDALFKAERKAKDCALNETIAYSDLQNLIASEK